MSTSRHTEAQIIAARKQVEAGRSAEDAAREYGVKEMISRRSVPEFIHLRHGPGHPLRA
jgi:hypothetical protein